MKAWVLATAPTLTCGGYLRGRDEAFIGSGKIQFGHSVDLRAFPTATETTGRRNLRTPYHVSLMDGYPNIPNGTNKDVYFAYNFSGEMNSGTSFQVSLFETNCTVSANDGHYLILADLTVDTNTSEVMADIGLQLDSITTSPFYKDTGNLSAVIHFCVRLDLLYRNSSMLFLETDVALGIKTFATNLKIGDDDDSTGSGGNGGALTATHAVSELRNASLGTSCEIEQYFCDDKFRDIGQPVFRQGDVMKACIVGRSGSYYNVQDVKEVYIDQYYTYYFTPPNSGHTDDAASYELTLHADLVTNFTSNPLTAVNCAQNRCMITSQLTSEFFKRRSGIPNIVMSGEVICGMGAQRF